MEYFPLPLEEAGSVEVPPVRLLSDVGSRVITEDPDGRPLPAAVYALPGETSPWGGVTGDGWTIASRFGWISALGNLSLPRAKGERLNLYVTPLGSARTERALDMESARFVLPERSGRALRVEVVADGMPVDGAIVAIGEIAWPVGMTESDGRLTVPGLRRRLLTLMVLARDGAVVRRRVDLANLPSDQPVTVQLPRRRRIAGRVVDDQNRPVPGALVWLGSDPGRVARSDGKGKFDLMLAEQGRVWIQGQARDHLPGIVWVDAEAMDSQAPLLLRLDRALTVQGRTLDSNGERLPGVDVVVDLDGEVTDRAFRRDSRFARARSGPDGTFSIDLRPGEPYVVEGERAGYRAARVRLDAKPGMDGGPVLRLARHDGARGRVLDWREQPAEGVRVWLLPAGSENRVALETRARRGALDPESAVECDGEGVFRVSHLPAMEIDLVAYGPGLAPTAVPGIRPSAGDGAVDLGTVVLRRGAELTGLVVDKSGDPVEGAAVRLLDPDQSITRHWPERDREQEPDMASGVDGRFRVSDLPPETPVRFAVDADGFRAEVVDLATIDGRKTIKVVLERQGSVSGQVLDPDGRPVTGARVTVSPKESETGVVGERPGMDAERTALTTEAGTFEIGELQGGAYAIEAYLEGFLTSSERTVTVALGAPVEGVKLHLRKGASVEGWVSTTEGEPVEGALVLFGRPAMRTGADGSFFVEGVELGRTVVEVRHPDFAWHEETLQIEEGTNLVEVQLQAGPSVSGEAQREDGEPVAGVGVRLTRRTRPYREYEARSGADGVFRFPSVESGSYSVKADGGLLVPIEPALEVDVGSEDVDDVLVRLRTGAVIHGSIEGLELDELSRVRLVASSPERGSRRGRVDHSGGYRIESVGPGVWWLKASLPGGTKEAEARVVVDETTSDVVADLDMASGVALQGVVFIDGEAVAGVLVSVTGLERSVSRTVRSDLEGRFGIENLREGRYRLTASDPRTSLIHNEVVDVFGDQQIAVRIESGRVQGVVTSQATGEGLQDAVVTLGQLEGGASGEVSRVTLATDSRGGFRIEKLSAGRYRLSVRRDGYAPRVSEVEVHAGEVVDLEVGLDPADGLRLVVRAADGGSPPWAYLRLSESRTGRSIEETRPLEGDLVSIPTVPPGVWDVLLAAPGGAPSEFRATVPGEPVEVVLQAAGRLRLLAPGLEDLGLEGSVQVLDGRGRPVAALDLETGTLRSRWPWRRNGVVIDSLPAGQWVVKVEGTNGATWVREVKTEGLGETLVTFE